MALNSAASATVPNALQTDFRKVSPTGYARSKFVGEHVVCRAAGEAGADACVLRIGQVVGDTREGIWNDQEFLPMMIRSSLVLGVLPLLSEVSSSSGSCFRSSHPMSSQRLADPESIVEEEEEDAVTDE